jgi:hypothetical protein
MNEAHPRHAAEQVSGEIGMLISILRSGTVTHAVREDGFETNAERAASNASCLARAVSRGSVIRPSPRDALECRSLGVSPERTHDFHTTGLEHGPLRNSRPDAGWLTKCRQRCLFGRKLSR